MTKPGILAATVVIALGIAVATTGHAADTKPKPFTVTSSSWKDNAMVARKYGGKLASNPNCDGDNVSPQLSWSNAPPATTSYAILMIDPDGTNGLGSVHWVAYDIPASKTSLKEGEANAPGPDIVYGDAQNGMPNGVYRGFCPQRGQRPTRLVTGRPAAQAFLNPATQPSVKSNREFLSRYQGIIRSDQGVYRRHQGACRLPGSAI
jgi:Raf kinase inhibitor-like YbhB/YbcL family protein